MASKVQIRRRNWMHILKPYFMAQRFGENFVLGRNQRLHPDLLNEKAHMWAREAAAEIPLSLYLTKFAPWPKGWLPPCPFFMKTRSK
jgi:hypothetical protein